MPYRFIVDGRSIECDTHDELRLAISVVDKPLPRTQVDDLDDLTPSNGHIDPLLTDELPKVRPYRRRKSAGTGNGANRSWREAKREARRQGRDDVAKVRSELAAARA